MPSLDELRSTRAEIGRALDKKLHERGEIRKEKRDKKKRDPKSDKRDKELRREIAKLAAEERTLTKRIKELRDREESVEEKIEREKREKGQREKVIVQAGAPHWGGAEDIIVNEVVPFVTGQGISATSGKRAETYGNPTSDHHTSQTTASARDFATAENFGLRDRTMQELGVGGSISDYGAYYIERAGRTFRVQPIAGTHGTGPHFHLGIRLV